MPTQQTTYNSRVTDEALEKKFRDTFKSQGGAELVDDLYAQGVIVPIVDFTAAAQGSELRPDLQTAWDFSTSFQQVSNSSADLTTTPGFYKVDLTATFNYSGVIDCSVLLTDGASFKQIWRVTENISTISELFTVTDATFVVYVRSGDTLRAQSSNAFSELNVWYRQVADVSGNLVNPLGFTSS